MNSIETTCNIGDETITIEGVEIIYGDIVDVVEELDDWKRIMYNNQTGYMMSKFLVKVTSEPAPKTWYVKVECESEADARAIAAALKLCGNAVAAQV